MTALHRSQERRQAQVLAAEVEVMLDAGNNAPQVVVSARDLAVELGGRTIWHSATFTIEAGEVITIVGPNGAGKSTLLRMLLGLLPNSRGQIQILGRQPQRGNPSIGYVPQR